MNAGILLLVFIALAVIVGASPVAIIFTAIVVVGLSLVMK